MFSPHWFYILWFFNPLKEFWNRFPVDNRYDFYIPSHSPLPFILLYLFIWYVSFYLYNSLHCISGYTVLAPMSLLEAVPPILVVQLWADQSSFWWLRTAWGMGLGSNTSTVSQHHVLLSTCLLWSKIGLHNSPFPCYCVVAGKLAYVHAQAYLHKRCFTALLLHTWAWWGFELCCYTLTCFCVSYNRSNLRS